MELFGYLLAVLIGVSLGLVGGGGSILTVPILVYVFHTDPLLATSYSLFIVGVTSLAGALSNFKSGFVDQKVALLFGLASITVVLLVRMVLLPLVPEMITTFGNTVINRSSLIMMLFAILMLLASYFMLKTPNEQVKTTSRKVAPILLYGVLTGLVTGLLGAGGGFLLIPALVMMIKLPMKTAVGTSLTIIAATSLIGFTGDVQHHIIDWAFLGLLAFLAITGVFAGIRLSRRLNGQSLKKGFGWFIFVTGMVVLLLEISVLL